MIYEELPPDTLPEKLQIRREELYNLLNNKLQSLKAAPQGHLRIAQSRGGRKVQYYHITSRGDTKGTYIPDSQFYLAKQLAQKQYDQNLVKLLRRQISAIDHLLAVESLRLPDISENKSLARRSLITPATLPDAQYVEAWQNITWQGLPFSDDDHEYFSANSERVRSKSEVIIADTLKRYNVPYRYEFPFELKNGDIYHPDFLCLNIRTRQEFIWEHFGMMDTPDYLERTVRKLKVFSKNQIIVGRNLIITMETAKNSLSTYQVQKYIEEFLL